MQRNGVGCDEKPSLMMMVTTHAIFYRMLFQRTDFDYSFGDCDG